MNLFRIIPWFLLSAFFLTAGYACSDTAEFIKAMKLDKETAGKATPVIDNYLKEQAVLFADMEKQKPGMGGPGKPPDRNGSMPEPSAMKEKMDRQMMETEKRFDRLDYKTMDLLKLLVSSEQVKLFQTYAREYRIKKLKEKMGDRQGPGGPGSGMGMPGQ